MLAKQKHWLRTSAYNDLTTANYNLLQLITALRCESQRSAVFWVERRLAELFIFIKSVHAERQLPFIYNVLNNQN